MFYLGRESLEFAEIDPSVLATAPISLGVGFSLVEYTFTIHSERPFSWNISTRKRVRQKYYRLIAMRHASLA